MEVGCVSKEVTWVDCTEDKRKAVVGDILVGAFDNVALGTLRSVEGDCSLSCRSQRKGREEGVFEHHSVNDVWYDWDERSKGIQQGCRWLLYSQISR